MYEAKKCELTEWNGQDLKVGGAVNVCKWCFNG